MGEPSDRQEEIAALVEEGLSAQDIAARLDLPVATVKNHVHSVLEKLGSSRRSEAASALRRDLPKP